MYGYIRVSTDKQTTENQRFEILKFAHEKKLSINRWIEETVSSTRKLSDRKLGTLLEVMSILHTLMEKDVKVFTTKERYELGNNTIDEICKTLHISRAILYRYIKTK